MSQEDIRRLLLQLGKEASLSELSDLASREFPDRKLHNYVQERLEAMKQKGLVQTKDVNRSTRWILTEKGENITLETKIDELGSVVNEPDLSGRGISIHNLVGSLDIGRTIDLNAISNEMVNVEYHPESYPNAIFRPEEGGSVAITITRSGNISIAGAESKQQLIESTEKFLQSLINLGIEVHCSPNELAIQNIVGGFEFEREFDLTALSIDLGLENVEYEPEQFPGLIYRSSQNSTILIFRSGKCVVTGAKSYLELLDVIKEVSDELKNIGVELPISFQE